MKGVEKKGWPGARRYGGSSRLRSLKILESKHCQRLGSVEKKKRNWENVFW